MTISTIGRRGQMTIPRAIRRLLNLEEGDRVAFIQREDEVILQPLKKTLFNLRGSIPTTEVQDFVAIRNQVLQEHAQKVGEGAA